MATTSNLLVFSDACVAMVRYFESCRLKSYWDSTGKVWTVGWGSTRGVGPNTRITQETADEWNLRDLREAASIVARNFPNLATQAQFDALTSFCYNVGPGKKGFKSGLIWLSNRRHSTIYRLVKAGEWEQAALEMRKWVYSGGEVLEGLIKRRMCEETTWRGKDWIDAIQIYEKQPAGMQKQERIEHSIYNAGYLPNEQLYTPSFPAPRPPAPPAN